MTPSLKQAVRRRGYRERTQAPQRAHVYKTLEKKRGWRERSIRYRRQQKLIQHLAEKARTRNPAEFSCKLLNASQIGGGVDGLKSKRAGLVALAQRDAEDASRKTPGAAAQALAELGRRASASVLVSERSQRRLQRQTRAAKDALEEASRRARRLLMLKEQTLRRRLKKQATLLAADCGARVSRSVGGSSASRHKFFEDDSETDSEASVSNAAVETAEAPPPAEGAEPQGHSSSGEESDNPWFARAQGVDGGEQEDSSGASAREASSSEEEDSQQEEDFQHLGGGEEPSSRARPKAEELLRLEKTLKHTQRLRLLNERLERQSEERSRGRRRSIRVAHEDGHTTKVSKWFFERKK